MTPTLHFVAAYVTLGRFPHTWTCALESMDKRNEPRNWFTAVRRSPVVDGERVLILHHEHEWEDALVALRVLSV